VFTDWIDRIANIQASMSFDFGRPEMLFLYYRSHFDNMDQNIPTLVIDHKGPFNDDEWQKIRLFEWHFCQTIGVENMTY
jgi:hypothetical protein